jgi:pantetheine-phosphate adenylyltransferase
MSSIAIYPGTFDPLTMGHLNIIERGLNVFDEVVVAIANNTSKRTLFTEEERLAHLQTVFGNNPRVRIDSFQGLLVDYARKMDAHAVLRGIRTVSDYEYEFQMALANKRLYPEMETIFMMTDAAYSYLSSTIIKEIVRFGGSVTGMVPEFIAADLNQKFAGS